MAVTEGFEPSIQFPVCSLSRAVVSATHPRHQAFYNTNDLFQIVVGGHYSRVAQKSKTFFKIYAKISLLFFINPF